MTDTKNLSMIADLGNGLILRRSSPQDADALARFNGMVHADPDEDSADHIGYWVKDLLKGDHPTFHPEDFTIVEDTTTGEIVSSLNLIDQTWAYEGIEFGVGRPELVGTHPDYRRRGLVRKQFEVVHQWSAERGHKVQAITGIPWYYRQFGYEMTLNLGGSRAGYLQHIPKLGEGEEEPYLIRPMEEKDIPFVTRLYNQNMRRYPISCVRDETIWRYELLGRDKRSATVMRIHILETPNGKPAGYVIFQPVIFGTNLQIIAFELSEGRSWYDASLSVLRYAKKIGENYSERDSTEDKKVEMQSFSFELGEEHPVYHVIPNRLPRINKPYSWYLRVPDIPDFLTHISPVLEERLERSYLVGFSGVLKFDFYTDGAIMTFENGKIKSVEPWDKPERDDASVHFPDLTFLKVLFGHRSFEEIDLAFTDSYVSWKQEEAGPLVKILFPKKPSRVLELA